MWPITRLAALAVLLVLGALAPSSAQLTLTGSGSNQYGAGGAPPVTCASTGVYDLSNVCNDIYFIGALR